MLFEEQSGNDYEIRILTMEDRPLVYEFVKKYFYTDEPLNESMNRDGQVLLQTLSPDDCPIEHLSEGLSLMAVTPTGEIIGVATNAEYKQKNQHSDDMETASSDAKSEARRAIKNLLNHTEEQITLLTNLKSDEGKEMEIRSITVHENWRNRGVGRKLLEQSRDIAAQRGFKRIRSTCTSAYSAKMFINYGFECVYALSYKDCKKEGRIIVLPQPPHTHIKGMMLKL